MLVLASAVRPPLSFAGLEDEVEESSTGPATAVVSYGGPWVTCSGGRGSTTLAAVQCGGYRFNNRSPVCTTSVTGTASAPGRVQCQTVQVQRH